MYNMYEMSVKMSAKPVSNFSSYTKYVSPNYIQGCCNFRNMQFIMLFTKMYIAFRILVQMNLLH